MYTGEVTFTDHSFVEVFVVKITLVHKQGVHMTLVRISLIHVQDKNFILHPHKSFLWQSEFHS